jgi:hypothetical protein
VDDCAPAAASLNQRDDDGDGITSCEGDCDDSDDSIHPGAPESEGDAVDSDCDGWFGAPVSWSEEVDGEGNEVNEGPSLAGFSVTEEIPWAEGHYQELGSVPAWTQWVFLTGEISSIVPESWEGDVDGYHFDLPLGGVLSLDLHWDAQDAADYDAAVYCLFGNEVNPEGYYSMPFDPGLTGTTHPEQGTMVVSLAPEADCWMIVVGYDGLPGGYTLGFHVGDGPPETWPS